MACFFRLERGNHIGIGDHFNQGNTQPVGGIYPVMSNIRDFATGILFKTHLDDPDFFLRQVDLSFEPDNGSSLKTCGDTAIQILFSDDVNFPYNVEFKHMGDF